MSTQENKDIVRRWWEALNQRTAPQIIDDTYASDYILHDPPLPNQYRELMVYANLSDRYSARFPMLTTPLKA